MYVNMSRISNGSLKLLSQVLSFKETFLKLMKAGQFSLAK